MPFQTTIFVPGMTCQNCVKHVTAELTSIGATDVTVDLVPQGTSTVTFVSQTPIAPQAVKAAIDEAGYTVTPSP